MWYFIFPIFLCLSSLVLADAPGGALFSYQREPELIVYNRVLARINGKTFSVVDVMKKMDLFLQRNYPHMVSSKAACYQFYSSQWKETLSQMINEELIFGILSPAERGALAQLLEKVIANVELMRTEEPLAAE